LHFIKCRDCTMLLNDSPVACNDAASFKTKQGSSGGSSSTYHQRLQAQYGGNSVRSSSSSSQAGTGPRASGERSGSGGQEAPTCSICLDKFEEGSQVRDDPNPNQFVLSKTCFSSCTGCGVCLVTVFTYDGAAVR
jgi:hypothetical protein